MQNGSVVLFATAVQNNIYSVPNIIFNTDIQLIFCVNINYYLLINKGSEEEREAMEADAIQLEKQMAEMTAQMAELQVYFNEGDGNTDEV